MIMAVPQNQKSELFNRILRNEGKNDAAGSDDSVNKNLMITKVAVRPNPFNTVLTLDVSCDSNKHIIVRMFSEEGRIVKMFSWYLVKGSNITAINDLSSLSSGQYVIDIIDNEGSVLFSSTLQKQ